MSTLTEQFRPSLRSWWAYEILGVFLIIMSALVIAFPVSSFVGLVFYFTFTFFIAGVLKIATALSNRDVVSNWVLYAIGGLIDIALGMILVSNFELSAYALAFYVGFFVLFSSVTALTKSFDLKAQGHKGWGWTLSTAVAGLIVAIMLILNPILGIGTLILWTALGFLTIGGFYVYLGIELHKIDHLVDKKV